MNQMGSAERTLAFRREEGVADLVGFGIKAGYFPLFFWLPGSYHTASMTVAAIFAGLLTKVGVYATFDTQKDWFAGVIRACAESPRPGQDGTWITDEIVAAYTALHRAGRAHSVEVRVDGELVGGLYGVAVGRVFCGESMFFRRPDASKVALAHLVARLGAAGFALIDCQQVTPHLLSLGARAIPRDVFLDTLEAHRDLAPAVDPWA